VELEASYDRVAQEYTREFHDEMDRKPFDRKMLDWLVEKVDGSGSICDMGCGPGQVARYLSSRGAAACGIDLSVEMVNCAKRLNPDTPFQQGDMLALNDVAGDTFGGIAAFYSIIHVAPADMVRALQELKRVLRPQGVLLLAFHIGKEVVHKDEWWGKTVSVDFIFYETEDMKNYLKLAGLEVEEVIERDPYADVEYPSRRAYLFARKPQR
jgi:SAM-dependent methyltransferase